MTSHPRVACSTRCKMSWSEVFVTIMHAGALTLARSSEPVRAKTANCVASQSQRLHVISRDAYTMYALIPVLCLSRQFWRRRMRGHELLRCRLLLHVQLSQHEV